jgi:hypothetical protein
MNQTRWIASALAGFAALALGTAAQGQGDILVLKDGRFFDGLKLGLVEGGYVVHYPNGDVIVPFDAVEDALMESPPPFVPQTVEEKERADKGQVPFDGKWMSESNRNKLIEKLLAQRREELAERRSHELWRNRYTTETKHFRFEYTVPEHVFAPLREKMEAYFTAFAKEWGIKQPRDLGRLSVCFYPDYQQFLQVSGTSTGVLGYFRFVTPMDLNFFYDRTDVRLVEEVMYHETNHYLQKLLEVGFKMPHFPGESIAEFYGASDYDPDTKKFTTGLVLEGRLNEVKQDIIEGEEWGLQKLICTDGAYQHYTWGWTLVHYLMHDDRYAKSFQKFVRDLCAGKGIRTQTTSVGADILRYTEATEVWELFKKHMGLRTDEDVAALEGAWHAYIKDELKTTSAQGLADAAHNAERANLKIKARRLYREALDGGDDRAITRHRYASMLRDEGEYGEAAENWRKAIELDPMEALYRYRLGSLLKAHLGNKEEGTAMLRLARDMNPAGLFRDSWRATVEVDWDDELED